MKAVFSNAPSTPNLIKAVSVLCAVSMLTTIALFAEEGSIHSGADREAPHARKFLEIKGDLMTSAKESDSTQIDADKLKSADFLSSFLADVEIALADEDFSVRSGIGAITADASLCVFVLMSQAWNEDFYGKPGIPERLEKLAKSYLSKINAATISAYRPERLAGQSGLPDAGLGGLSRVNPADIKDESVRKLYQQREQEDRAKALKNEQQRALRLCRPDLQIMPLLDRLSNGNTDEYKRLIRAWFPDEKQRQDLELRAPEARQKKN